MNNKYLGDQKDGTHYTDMKLQPVQLAEMLGSTPEYCKVAKYLTRDKNDKFINLEKACHCIGLEEELGVSFWKYPWNVIVGKYWDYFKPYREVHPYIKQYTENLKIQEALQCMLIKDYDGARRATKQYEAECRDAEE